MEDEKDDSIKSINQSINEADQINPIVALNLSSFLTQTRGKKNSTERSVLNFCSVSSSAFESLRRTAVASKMFLEQEPAVLIETRAHSSAPAASKCLFHPTQKTKSWHSAASWDKRIF